MAWIDVTGQMLQVRCYKSDGVRWTIRDLSGHRHEWGDWHCANLSSPFHFARFPFMLSWSCTQVLRCGGLLDLRALPSERHCDLLMRLAEISSPHLVRILMVYPVIYELIQENKGVMGNTGTSKPIFTGVPPKKGKYRQVKNAPLQSKDALRQRSIP